MILISELRLYWQNILKVIPSVRRIDIVTDESQIRDFISDITLDEQPFVIVLIPSAVSSGSTPDNFQEQNNMLFYVLQKEDSFNKSTLDVQEELQPIVEELKQQILTDKSPCNFLRNLDEGSFRTDPENKLWSKCTGWSVSFNA